MALSTGLSNPDPTIKLPPMGDLSLPAAQPTSFTPQVGTGSVPIGNDQPLVAVLSGGRLDQFTDSIIKQEGGSPAGVLNNPGNIKFRNLPGQVDSGVRATDGGTFASYVTPEAGRQAIGDLVRHAAQGGSPMYGPSPTVGSFLQRYQGKGISDEGLIFGPSAQSQEAAQQVQRAKRDEAASLDQRAKEAIAALDNMRGDQKESMQRIKAAQDAATQSLQATMKAVQSQPRRPELDSLQKFGSLATVVGILGGLLTKSPMRGSLNAAAAAIEAYNSGDQTAYRQAFEQWKTQTDLLAHISDMQSRMLNDIVQDEKMSIDEQRLQFDLRLRALGLHDTANQLRTSAWEDARDFAQTYDKANFELKKAQQEMIKQANAKWGLASGLDPQGNRIQFEFNPEMPGGGVRDLKTAEPLPFMPTDIQPASTRSSGGGLEASKTLEILGPDGRVVKTVLARERKDAPGWMDSESGQPIKLEKGQSLKQITPSAAGGGRAGAQVLRQQIGGREVLSDLQNAVDLPVGTTTGIFGTFEPGTSIGDALRGDLVRHLTDQDAQLMKSSMASMTRELSILMSPVFGGNYAAKQIEPLIPVKGDTIGTAMFKLARIAQSADNALEAMSKSPILSNDQQDYAGDLRKQINQAIFWTTHQALDFARQGDTSETFSEFAKKHITSGQAGVPSDLPSPEGHPDGYKALDKDGHIVAKIVNGKWAPP